MKMYLPFGDWSDDGHGKYKSILIEAPSMESLRDAQIEIEKKYGEYFWEGFCQKYDSPHFSSKVQQALIDTGYPLERYNEYGCLDLDSFSSLKQLFSEIEENFDDYTYIPLELCIDAFIWILNAFGANIKQINEEIPMICNWTCNGFKTVGYGCF